MILPPDWREFFDSLIARDVRFLLVGAHAMAANGRPRATQDVDVWVEPTPENAARLCQARRDFGLDLVEGAESMFSTPGTLATIGNPPLRIDVMTSIDGIEFEAAFGRAIEAEFGDRRLMALSLSDLITNKRASGRPKDLLDLALLEEGV